MSKSKGAARVRFNVGLIIVLGVLGLSACKASDLSSKAGHYQGLLSEKNEAKTVQTIVSGDMVASSFLHLDLKIATFESHPRSWSYQIAATKRGQVSVVDLDTGAVTPLKSTADACYINASAPSVADATLRLCYQSNQVSIDIRPSAQTDLSFILQRADASNLPTLEAPADYSVSELTRRSLSRSFSSQIEFQNVVLARLNSESAHLNLIPHFSVGDLMGLTNIATNWLGLIRMVGDIAPFLIPSNWFKAKAAGFQSEAEQFGYRLMQADSGNITAGLSYGIVRDTLSLAKLEEERDKIVAVRREVYDRERLGALPEGSTDSIDSVLNAVDKTTLGLRSTISQEYASLAQAAGFFNPKAIVSVSVDTALSIEKPETFDGDQVSQLALTRASELKQMDFLISAAKTQRTERYFDWLDPSGGGGSIGFGMGTYIAIASAQLQQLVVKRQQLQAQILQKVANTNINLNEAVSAYALAKRNIVLQDTLVKNYLSQLRLGISVSTMELINAFGGQVQANLDAINARFQYLVAHENMERALYMGAYSSLASAP